MPRDFDRLGLSAFPHIEGFDPGRYRCRFCTRRNMSFLHVIPATPGTFLDARWALAAAWRRTRVPCSMLAGCLCAQLKLLTSRPLRYNARALIVLAWSARQS